MSDIATLPIDEIKTKIRPSRNFWAELYRNLRRNRSARAGAIILGFLVFLAIFASVIATHNPVEPMLGKEPGAKVRNPPCSILTNCSGPVHWMGLDLNGRDVFSRVVYGTRISLSVGAASVIFAMTIGVLLGLVAGYAGGWADNLIMRAMDVVLAFPSLLLAIVFVTILEPRLKDTFFYNLFDQLFGEPRLFIVLLAIAIVFIPVYARVTRASVLSVKENEFIMAVRALGANPTRIVFRHIMPHALTPLIVQATLGIGTAILDAAALSFLGLGAQPPTPEWGAMLSEARAYVFTAPHIVFFPGFFIMLTVLGFNLLGDGLRDALDPRLNRS